MPTFTQLQDILLEPSVIQCAKGISQVLLKAHSVSSNGTERVTFGSSHPLQVNFELLMAELNKPETMHEASPEQSLTKPQAQSNPEEGSISSKIILERPPSSPLFTRIAARTLHVVRSEDTQQLHAYYPVTFSPTNFCQLDVTVHVSLLHLKFRTKAYSRMDVTPDDSSSKRSATSSLWKKNDVNQPPENQRTFANLLVGEKHSAGVLESFDVVAASAKYNAYLQPLLRSLGATAAALRSLEEVLDHNKQEANTAALEPRYATNSAGELEQHQERGSLVGSLSVAAKANTSAHGTWNFDSGTLTMPFGLPHHMRAHLRNVNTSTNANTHMSNHTLPGYNDHLANKVPGSLVDPVILAGCVERDLKVVAQHCFKLWGRLVTVLPQHEGGGHMRVAGRLRRTWLDLERHWWSRFVTSSYVKIQKILQPHDEPTVAALVSGVRISLAGPDGLPQTALHAYDPSHVTGDDGDVTSMAVCHQTFYLRGEPRDNLTAQASTCNGVALESTEVLQGNRPRRAILVDAFSQSDPVQAAHRLEQPPQPSARLQFDPVQTKVNSQQYGYKGPHLVILQHGWYATSHDMRLLQSYIKLLFPKAVVLAARSNEENSSLPISKMGTRLAHEVRNYIAHNFPALGNLDPRYGRISFLGHSIGSVIIRAAIASPLFSPFRSKLHTFITLSSSHCGNKYMTSALVSGGMWAIMQLQKSTLLEELQLTDKPSRPDAFIYKLSAEKGLEHFRFVILVASRQDSYVPVHSAHIQIPRPAEIDNPADGGIYIDMARNMLSPIMKNQYDHLSKGTTVIRLTLDQKFSSRNVDAWIGRAAHVAMLETPSLVMLLLFSLYDFMR
mmetsp:Transcript_22498/g.70377  ORF Transcript_22498/g.70377 Transcript_22498/m.70377 type:complete len:841 (+) Transcript_22498:409-2931(+)